MALSFVDRVRSWVLPAAPSLALPEATVRALVAGGPGGRDVAVDLAEEFARGVGGWALPRRGSAELLAAYSTTPWLHATVRRRAEALASVEWVLYRRGSAATAGDRVDRFRGVRSGPELRHRAIAHLERDKRLTQVTDHPLLDLLDNPTDSMPGSLFWELLSKWLDLVGEAPQAITVGDGGLPVELCPVLPTWLAELPTTEAPYFLVRPTFARGPFKVPVDEMIWVRQHDPAQPYNGRGVGTAHVLADELETDEYMSATAKSRFYNRATPDWILGILPSTPGGSTPPAAVSKLSDEIRQKHAGPNRAGNFHVVGSDVRAVSLSQSLVDNQFIDGRKFLRDACMQVFGTPPEILGVLSSSNRSTIDAADYLFAKFSTLPQLERLRSFYQAQLVPWFGDDLILDFVSPVPADVEHQTRVMLAVPEHFSANEFRALAGRDPRRGGDEPTDVDVNDAGAPTISTVEDAAAAGVVQDTALNGAQVDSLLAIVDKVAAGLLPTSTAKAVMTAAFPAIPSATVDTMLAGLDDFTPAAPEVPNAVDP